MQTEQEFQKLFDEKLVPELLPLEEERKKVAKNIYLLIAGIFFGWVLSVILIPQLFLHLGAIAFIGGVVLYGFTVNEYIKQFKSKVLPLIVSFLGPSLRYNPESGISQSEFNSSQIFTTSPNIYFSEDEVSGNVENTNIRFSEVDAKRQTGSGKHRRTVNIFHGLFFIGDFNKTIKGRTFVTTDMAQGVFGGLVGGFLQEHNIARPPLVKLEDPEFEKYFAVYGDDQIEARYVLSPSLMQRILDYKKARNSNIQLSFISNKVYVAIPYAKNLFEPPIFSTLLDFKTVKNYYNDFQMAKGIVLDLNLDSNVWGQKKN